jgi:hypothetical protein
MAELKDPQDCKHRLMDMRICEQFPERYYECTACGTLMLQDVVQALDFPGLTARLSALIPALAGRTRDERPLEDILAPPYTLKDAWPLWPTGRIQVRSGSQEDLDDQESEPSWGRAS